MIEADVVITWFRSGEVEGFPGVVVWVVDDVVVDSVVSIVVGVRYVLFIVEFISRKSDGVWDDFTWVVVVGSFDGNAVKVVDKGVVFTPGSRAPAGVVAGDSPLSDDSSASMLSSGS